MTPSIFRPVSRRAFLAAAASVTLAGCQSKPRTTVVTAARSLESWVPAGKTCGPLRVHPENPRYFADAAGRPVYLAGAHTWPNLVDQGPADPPAPFDFDGYLAFLRRHRHNFARLWTWESPACDIDEGGRRMRYYATPQPWLRVGKDRAMDGKPKFDLLQFNPDYFTRLRQRVSAARDRGVYLSIMLFEGWAMQHALGAWASHPFHAANNVNGINGDVNKDNRGLDIFTLTSPKTLEVQEAYVRKVVDTVNDLDNVLYEISNENHPPSTEWQYHMIRFVREYERNRGQTHPVGMTFQYKGGSNQTLFDSPADWVSPNPEGGYRDDPPSADGRKVMVNDTDHLWGIGGSADWVWKSFLRGHQVLFMDPYDGITFGAGNPQRWEAIRRALGQTRFWAERINLAAMTPQPTLASSGYCLATKLGGAGEWLVYQPEAKPVELDLGDRKGPWHVEWFNPDDANIAMTATVTASGRTSLGPPFNGPSVLHLTT